MILLQTTMRSKYIIIISLLVLSLCYTCRAQNTNAYFDEEQIEENEVEYIEGDLEEYSQEEYEDAYEEEYIEYSEEEAMIEVEEEIQNPFITTNPSSPFKEIDTSFKARYQDPEHTYREKKEKKKKEEKPVEQSKPKDYNPAPIQMTGFAKVVFYIFLALAVGLIGYLLFMSLKNFRIEKKAKLNKIEPHKEIEQELAPIEELDPNDLKNLIQKARSDGYFSLAIRYYFLLYLEKLEKNEYIVYNKDKTNTDYLLELKQETHIAEFIKVSYLFEYVWYGKKAIDQETFASLEKTFNDQINAIK
ncbi:MAG: cell division protein FtsL [Lentimonas sp.]|jgi:cell division protein FtsL